MPKPRTPLARALVTGALVKNPQRYRTRAEPTANPLGNPPSWMTPEQRETWDAFAAELPWLNTSHTALVEIAATLRARLRHGDPSMSSAGLLRLCLGQMGAPR